MSGLASLSPRTSRNSCSHRRSAADCSPERSRKSIAAMKETMMPQDVATHQANFDLTPPTREQIDALVADLSDEERHVLLEHGTEAPFCGVFLNEKRPGVFTCRLCGLPLFHGGTKFESGTGWPSFTQPFAEGHRKTI